MVITSAGFIALIVIFSPITGSAGQHVGSRCDGRRCTDLAGLTGVDRVFRENSLMPATIALAGDHRAISSGPMRSCDVRCTLQRC
jgi:hypothetical protein